MAITFQLTQEQYEALIALARAGAMTTGDATNLEAFLKQIEDASGVVRSIVWVQWQEMDQPLPASANFPVSWPPELRWKLERIGRPITKDDVKNIINQKARKPTNVLCTKDPSGNVGWTKLDDFFTQ